MDEYRSSVLAKLQAIAGADAPETLIQGTTEWRARVLALLGEITEGAIPEKIAEDVSSWLEENITQPTTPVVDTSLSVSGAAADAKATGDAINAKSGLSDEAKQALLTCFENVAWINEDGQSYVDALEAALYPPANLVSISAVYTQSGTVYDTDTLDSLKADLVVTATYDNGTTQTITAYTLSGTLTEGTSTITVSYGGKTTTFDVTVSAVSPLYPFINGAHTFSDGSVLTVTNGNHVKYECKNTYGGQGNDNPFFNISNVLGLGTNKNDSTNVNNQPSIFTIPSGATAVLSVKNMTATSGSYIIQFNMRKANTNVAVFASPISVTDASGSGTTTVSAATNVGCVYTFFNTCQANVTYEFDVELTVDGDRYI